MIGLMIFCIFSAFFAFALACSFSFLCATDGRLAKTLKRIQKRKASNKIVGSATMHDIGQSVSDAAKKARKALRYSAGEDAYGALKRSCAKFVFLSDERRGVVQKKLIRAGYKVSAEEFYADVILRVIAVFLLIPLFFLLDIKLAAIGTVALGIGLYYKWIGEPDERLRRITAEISDELPRFVSVLNYSMTTDRDLTRTIERYIKIAKPAFKAELELLLLEMKAGNIAEALKRFDARIGIAQLSAFVSGLIDAGRGVDQKTFFYLMEENMRQLFIENKRKELSKRPLKVKKAIISVGLCMFLIYLVPICKQLLEGLAMFR